jgi:hypothetical protein
VEREHAASEPARVAANLGKEEITISGHSNLLYWWVVWFWGLVCAGLTWLQGTSFNFPESKLWLVHPRVWVGTSFILLVGFIVLFTNIRLKSVYTLLICFIIASITVGLSYIGILGHIRDLFALIVVYMNMAFYTVFSSMIFLIWLIGFLVDRLSYWRFTPGRIESIHILGQDDSQAFPAGNVIMRRQADDFIRHKLLGLGWFGFGTGNIVIEPHGKTGERFIIENVWRVTQKLDDAEKRSSSIITVQR